MASGKPFPKRAVLVFAAVIAVIRLSLFLESPTRLFSTALLAAVLFLYVPVHLYWSRGFPAWTRVGSPRKTLGTALLLVVAGAAVFSLLFRLPLPPELTPPREPIPISPALAAHLMLLAALPEEVFFRGYLYDAFEEAGWEPIIPTALLFALGHVALYPTPYRLLTFFPGLLFGWGRKNSGNIYVPIAVHFIFNLFPSLIGGGA
ncbi:MAG: CPBP family intramembrane metalloprotease [Deltaproteobacteria bacterium]|nr:CPBP family intramembrane metalloprotease [Deltaproteobacteria bacterium]